MMMAMLTDNDILFPGFSSDVNLDQFFGHESEPIVDAVIIPDGDSNVSSPVSSPIQQQSPQPEISYAQPVYMTKKQQQICIKNHRQRSYTQRLKLIENLQVQVQDQKDELLQKELTHKNEVQKLRVYLSETAKLNRENTETIQMLQYQLETERETNRKLHAEYIKLKRAQKEPSSIYSFDLPLYHEKIQKLSHDYDVLRMNYSKLERENENLKVDYKDLLDEYNILRSEYNNYADCKRQKEELSEQCEMWKMKYEEAKTDSVQLLLHTKESKPEEDANPNKKKRGRPSNLELIRRKFGVVEIE